ncbi:MAG: 2-amino-4-hydroxy-6-hydroxymethyldihydropteridine diphosphokinase [Sediminibacterium sp.]
MNTAYLLIGGNVGDRAANLQTALRRIAETCGAINSTSSLYETAAWGNTDQPSFYNQAVVVTTPLSPEGLMDQLLDIELEMGRIRTQKYGPRTIDLDILMIDDLVLNTEKLTIPHPQMQNRRFALLPLIEVAPTLIHPLFDQSIEVLLQNCPDTLDVQKK